MMLAQRFATIYEIVGDFFNLGNLINGDVTVTSPPSWGGPE